MARTVWAMKAGTVDLFTLLLTLLLTQKFNGRSLLKGSSSRLLDEDA